MLSLAIWQSSLKFLLLLAEGGRADLYPRLGAKRVEWEGHTAPPLQAYLKRLEVWWVKTDSHAIAFN